MKSNLFERRYLFHFHADYTDGKLSVKDYFDCAESDGTEKLVFVEHIRRKPNYDLGEFLTEIRECGRSHTGADAHRLEDLYTWREKSGCSVKPALH